MRNSPVEVFAREAVILSSQLVVLNRHAQLLVVQDGFNDYDCRRNRRDWLRYARHRYKLPLIEVDIAQMDIAQVNIAQVDIMILVSGWSLRLFRLRPLSPVHNDYSSVANKMACISVVPVQVGLL